MNMGQRTRAASLHEILSRAILENRFCGPRAFPSVRQLARMYSVSPSTAAKAVKLLRKNGFLAGGEGRKYRVALPDCSTGQDVPIENAAFRAPSTACERIARQIARDIERGLYPPAAMLPAAKQMSARYGISFHTLKKSLALLVSQNCIEPHKRGYRVCSTVRPSRGENTILVLAAARESGQMAIGDLNRELLAELERRCMHRDLRMEKLLFTAENPPLRFIDSNRRFAQSFRQEKGLLGTIYLVHDSRALCEEITRSLSHFTVPVAVIDEIGGWDIETHFRRFAALQKFTMTTSREPGRAVARYLRDRDHRHVAFFSPFHDMHWSKVRLSGMVDIFGGSDGSRVHAFTHALPSGFTALHAPQRSNIDSLRATYASWRKRIPLEYRLHLDPMFEFMVTRSINRGEIQRLLECSFEKALGIKEISAWVCANDIIGHMALLFLQRKNIAIPRQLSLLSFDNIFAALENSLTSFDFNHAALSNAVLDFILRPGMYRSRSPNRAVQIEGYVVERGSVAAANAA